MDGGKPYSCSYTCNHTVREGTRYFVSSSSFFQSPRFDIRQKEKQRPESLASWLQGDAAIVAAVKLSMEERRDVVGCITYDMKPAIFKLQLSQADKQLKDVLPALTTEIMNC